MKERPIIFNSEMVKAVLDGRKNQTRRIIKIDSPTLEFDTCNPPWPTCADQYGDFYRVPCKYGKAGDRLWVKETFHVEYHGNMGIKDIWYKADGERSNKWTPSIHMHRKRSRITLEIVNVRVERLKDITIKDCLLEGATMSGAEVILKSEIPHKRMAESVFMNFKILWESIYGKGSWELNPWVWVIEFKRI